MRAPFDPKSLVKLLTGFARMGHISSSSSGMLDAVAGFVIRRMTAGHLNAVTKPADLAQLLQAYAVLGHSTVVMPDLLTAVSNQVGTSQHIEHILLIRTGDPSHSFGLVSCWQLQTIPEHLPMLLSLIVA